MRTVRWSSRLLGGSPHPLWTDTCENITFPQLLFIRSSGGSRGVNLLLKGGENGMTALHDAVDNNHPEIARLLLQFGGKSIKHCHTLLH